MPILPRLPIIYSLSIAGKFKVNPTFVFGDSPLKYHLIDGSEMGEIVLGAAEETLWLWSSPTAWQFISQHSTAGQSFVSRFMGNGCQQYGTRALRPRPISNHARKSLPKTSLESNKFNLSGLARLGVRLIHLQFQSKQTKCILSSSSISYETFSPGFGHGSESEFEFSLGFPMKMQPKLSCNSQRASLETLCTFPCLLFPHSNEN